MARREAGRRGNLVVLPGGGEILERPPWLSDTARGEWDRVVPRLQALGLTDPADEATLAAYCEAVARLREATRIVARTGVLWKDPGGGPELRRNPAVAQARDAAYEVRMWAREFGLTPAARVLLRQGLPDSPDAGADPGRPRHSATDGRWG